MGLRKLLPLAVLLLAAGCAMSPEDQMVGIWSLASDPPQLPKAPFPAAEDRIRDLTRNFKLKLLSDRTFVLTSAGIVEGTWSFKGGKLELSPKKGAPGGWIHGTHTDVAPDLKTMEISRSTMFGDIRVKLRKTG